MKNHLSHLFIWKPNLEFPRMTYPRQGSGFDVSIKTQLCEVVCLSRTRFQDSRNEVSMLVDISPLIHIKGEYQSLNKDGLLCPEDHGCWWIDVLNDASYPQH